MENLEKLSSPELLSRLKTAARDERLLQVRVLELLREANRRRLFAAKGYRSLFEFCVKELGYAESAAYRRISAMKLIDDVPEIREKLASGQLNLSHLTSAQSFIQSEARFANKTFSSAEKAALITSLENKTAKEAEMLLATLSPSALPRERERTLTPEETEIRFVANAPLKGKLDKLKDLNSHRDPSRSYQKLFDWLSDLGLRQADPLMKKARSRPTGPPPKGHYRHIPAALRRAVWSRDRSRCTYIDPSTGRSCGSTSFLEIDHIQPLALGGATQLDNLRLYCRTHNQYAARMTYGEGKIRSETSDH